MIFEHEDDAVAYAEGRQDLGDWAVLPTDDGRFELVLGETL